MEGFPISIAGLSQESPDSRQFRRVPIGNCGLIKISSGNASPNAGFPAKIRQFNRSLCKPPLACRILAIIVAPAKSSRAFTLSRGSK